MGIFFWDTNLLCESPSRIKTFQPSYHPFDRQKMLMQSSLLITSGHFLKEEGLFKSCAHLWVKM